MNTPQKILKYQTGSALIEFALSFTIFWFVFMGVVEFSRAMFAWNSVQEATNLAARLASECDNTTSQKTAITEAVNDYLKAAGNIDTSKNPAWLTFEYFPVGCTTNCTSLTSKTNGLKVNMMMPFIPISFTLPEFKTFVLRESMANVLQYNGLTESNSFCN